MNTENGGEKRLTGMHALDSRAVDVDTFFAETSSSCNISTDSLLQQLSNAEEKGQDFFMQISNTLYRVPKADITKFFTEYKRPAKPMSVQQQNVVLRQQLEEAVTKLKDAGLVDKELVTYGVSTFKDQFKPPDEQNLPMGKAKVGKIQNPVPSPEQREAETMTPAQIQADLVKQVKGKQPLKSDEAAEKDTSGKIAAKAADRASRQTEPAPPVAEEAKVEAL